MKIKFARFDLDDYRSAVVVQVDGKQAMSFKDGEPEDNTIDRNFNDIFNLPELLRQAHEAGKRGEELVIENSDKDLDKE